MFLNISKFATFTTQNEHGSWFIKQGVKIEDIKKELNWCKEKFKTIGEFIDYKHKLDEQEESKWIVNRMNYLHNKGTWY